VPSWFLVTEEHVERLTEYVRNGGTLVLNPRAGVKVKLNRCWPEPLPSLLRDLAGAEVDDYTPLYDGEHLVLWADGRDFVARYWAEFLEPKGAEVVATWERGLFPGEAAVTRNRVGQGTCYYLGTMGGPEAYDTLVEHIVDGTDILPYDGVPAGVDVRWRMKDGTALLFVVNQTSEEQYVPLPEVSETLLGPKASGTIALGPFDVAIYKA